MGFLDKVKNMFIEELDDEDVIKRGYTSKNT
jgi:hypothetical protein